MVVSPNGLTSAESLKLKLGTLPELTFEMVPKKMGDIARTISKSQQVSPSMAILACIATVNAAVAGKYQIAPVTKNWTEEFSSLYVAIIAESGGRKSTVFKKVTKPIEGWEQKKRKELLPAYIEAQQKVKAKRKALKDLQDQAYPEPVEEPESDPEDEDEVGEVKGDPVAKEELSTGHAQEELQAALAAVPVLPDLLVNDATPEALEVRCADHEGRVAIFDPEGGPLKNITGKRWKTPPSFELMKKAFSGEKHRSDRIGRGTTEVHQPAITVLLMTQPSLMTEMAKNKSMRGEGLWNRFLFLYLPSNKANLKPSHKAPALNKEVTDEWNKSVCRLLDANHKGTTPHLSPNGDKVQQVPILHDLPLSKGAQTVREDFEVSVLLEMQKGHRLEAVDEHCMKVVGISLRVAADLELFKRASKGIEGVQVFETEISEESMKMAVQILEVLSDHFVYVMANPRFDPVLYVYEKYRAVGSGCTSRELLRKCRRFSSKAELDPYVTELEERGLLKKIISEFKGNEFEHYENTDSV